MTLPKEEPIYSLLNPVKVHPEISSWLEKEYEKERIRKGIFVHIFITVNQISKKDKREELDEKKKRKILYIEDIGKPFECEIDIYGNKVALINHNPKGTLMGVIIHHPLIATTFKSFYLHYLWKL